MPQIGNEIFGRPQLLDIQQRNPSNINFVVAQTVLRSSPLLQYMSWKAVNSLAWPYLRRNVARVGQLRALNNDYAPKFAGGESQHVANLAILGDAFEWDRVLGSVNATEIESQIAAMSPGVGNRFADLLVNGSRGTNVLEFDGLSAITEAIGGNAVRTGLDLSVAETGNNTAFRRNLGQITQAVRTMQALGLKPLVIGNLSVSAALDLGGDVLGFTGRTPDAFGNGQITTIAGAPLIDAGMANVYGAPVKDALGRDVYPVEQREVIPVVDGVTDLYVVGVSDVSGVTGVTLDGFDARSPVSFQTARTDAGAVRRAELEMVAGVAALDDRAIIKFEDVKVG